MVFQGSGEDALQALEGLVAQHIVAKPHLTLMQLQRAVQAVSCLDSPCQLAALAVLVKGGYWLAAMQVSWQWWWWLGGSSSHGGCFLKKL